MKTINEFLSENENLVVRQRVVGKHLGQNEITYYDVINAITGARVAVIKEEEHTSIKRPFNTSISFTRTEIAHPN